MKKLMMGLMMVLTLVCFNGMTEAAERFPEITEVFVQEINVKQTNSYVCVQSIVKIDGQEYKKTEKIYFLDKNVEDHTVRYSNTQGFVKMAFHWREKNGKYEKSPHDKPVHIVTEKN